MSRLLLKAAFILLCTILILFFCSTSLLSSCDKATKTAEALISEYPYSRKVLINELSANGYSQWMAAFAADHCESVWNDKALLMAEACLKTQPYSEKGLTELLEKQCLFTHEEAVYAVTSCDLRANGSCPVDWTEQAKLDAEIYLDKGYTRKEIINALLILGFTEEQAICGTDTAIESKSTK